MFSEWTPPPPLVATCVHTGLTVIPMPISNSYLTQPLMTQNGRTLSILGAINPSEMHPLTSYFMLPLTYQGERSLPILARIGLQKWPPAAI